jgi:hypothetical protein
MGKNRLSFVRCVGVRRTLSRIENKGCNRSMVGHKVLTEALAIKVSNIGAMVEGESKRE